MILWSNKKCLVGPRIAKNHIINPKTLELDAAKQILAELFDVKTYEVDDMIQRRLRARATYGQEFSI
jgi:hypothetical protein